MKRTWTLSIIAMVMALGIFITSGSALAQVTVSGKVNQVNASRGIIAITKDGGGTITAQAPPNLLKGVKPGDKVSMSMAGPRVISLQKK